jgi:hypothetical protein
MDGDLSVWNMVVALERQQLERTLAHRADIGLVSRRWSLTLPFLRRVRSRRAPIEAAPVRLRQARGT